MEGKTVALERVVALDFEAESGQSSHPLVAVEEKDASGGKYVKMAPVEEDGKEVFPTLGFDFEAPVAGEYVVWLKLCPVSDRGYAYVSARVDDGPSQMFLCSFPERAASGSFRDTHVWRYVGQFRQSLPTFFHLEPGKHRLTVSSEPHKQDFGLDEVIITNDLSKRPPGRLLTWEEEQGKNTM
jgi:hypothetical protein